MKFNSFFLLIISLATVPSLVNIHPASAKPCNKCRLPPPVYHGGSSYGGGTLPVELSQRVHDLIAKGDFAGAERLLLQFKEQAERTQDLPGQAGVNQVLGDLYVRMRKPDLAASHLQKAGAIYQRLGNSQGSREVQVQLRQIQFQQRQLQQIQPQQR